MPDLQSRASTRASATAVEKRAKAVDQRKSLLLSICYTNSVHDRQVCSSISGTSLFARVLLKNCRFIALTLARYVATGDRRSGSPAIDLEAAAREDQARLRAEVDECGEILLLLWAWFCVGRAGENAATLRSVHRREFNGVARYRTI